MKRTRMQKHQPNKSQGKKFSFVCLFVFYQYRLKNDFKHLWKLASELLMHVFRLSLPSIFMNTLSGLWSFRSDFYPHQVVSLCRISTREKKKNQMKRKITRVMVNCSNATPPCQYTVPHTWKKLVKCLFPLLFSTVTVLCLAIVFLSETHCLYH